MPLFIKDGIPRMPFPHTQTSTSTMAVLPNLSGPAQMPLPPGSLMGLLSPRRTYWTWPKAPRVSNISQWASPRVGSCPPHSVPNLHPWPTASTVQGCPATVGPGNICCMGGRWVVIKQCVWFASIPSAWSRCAQSQHVQGEYGIVWQGEVVS